MCAVHGKTSSRGDLLFALQHIYKHVSWCRDGEEGGQRPAKLSGSAATTCGVVKGACDRAPDVAARGPRGGPPKPGAAAGSNVWPTASQGRQRRHAASWRNPRHEKRTPTDCFGVATSKGRTPRSPCPHLHPAPRPLPPPVLTGLKFERANSEFFLAGNLPSGREGRPDPRGARSRRHRVRRARRCASRPGGAIFGMCTRCGLIA